MNHGKNVIHNAQDLSGKGLKRKMGFFVSACGWRVLRYFATPMRWSEFFIPTLREAPADAEIASHRLLLRAGLARKLSGGLYTYLPLGLRSLKKIEAIIREEMNSAGALEVFMPALQPTELWKRGPRFNAAKKVMFKAISSSDKNLNDTELVLGPTHEEVITDLVANHLNSYRHLPKNFYQIQTKFRDEIRPRFGLMRAKEFIMKDAYSFDADDAAASVSYRKMFAAYQRIFSRIGLQAKIVEADTGVMGGSFSHEFSVPCNIGESEIVFTDDGSYAGAIEKAVSRPHPRKAQAAPSDAPEKWPTPGVRTIENLTKKHGVAACDQVKTLVYIADSKPVLLLLRGDHTLCEDKVAALGFEEYRPATDAEIFDAMGAHPGSLGAVGVCKPKVAGIYADQDLKDEKGLVTGANEDGFHLKNVDMGRDIVPDRYLSLRLVQEGELSLPNEADPVGGKPLKIQRAIEVGHVFKLGTKYSQAFGATYLTQEGKSEPVVMGCYGIGVSRTLQAVIEQNCDEQGIRWPFAVAPFAVVITLLDTSLTPHALSLKESLEKSGLDVLLDDRDERPGVKFKDADLIGFPVRVTVGEKSWAAGGVEVKLRTEKTARTLPVSEALQVICGWAKAS